MKKDITELYVIVDDFCQQYVKYFNSQIFPRKIIRPHAFPAYKQAKS